MKPWRLHDVFPRPSPCTSSMVYSTAWPANWEKARSAQSPLPVLSEAYPTAQAAILTSSLGQHGHQIRRDWIAAGILKADGDLLCVRVAGDIDAVHSAVAGANVNLGAIQHSAAAVSSGPTGIRNGVWS